MLICAFLSHRIKKKMSKLDLVIERSSEVRNFIEDEIASLSIDKLNWRENHNKWTVLEVLSHLNQVYELYAPKFEQALEHATKMEPPLISGKNQTTLLGRLSIYSMLPKKRKRRFKMTTFEFFEPISNPAQPNETIERFLRNKSQFEGFVTKSKSFNIEGLKVSTALGEKVRFYIPECFEFIMAHEERHIVQIDELLALRDL